MTKRVEPPEVLRPPEGGPGVQDVEGGYNAGGAGGSGEAVRAGAERDREASGEGVGGLLGGGGRGAGGGERAGDAAGEGDGGPDGGTDNWERVWAHAGTGELPEMRPHEDMPVENLRV